MIVQPTGDEGKTGLLSRDLSYILIDNWRSNNTFAWTEKYIDMYTVVEDSNKYYSHTLTVDILHLL